MKSNVRMLFATAIVALAMGSIVLAQTNVSVAGVIPVQTIDRCTVIDKPGSYTLAKNITARVQDLRSTGPSCILIVADFVTLDLRGYTLTGPGTGFGIYSTANSSGKVPVATHVSNGVITNFSRGIAFEGAAHTAKELRLVRNVGVGISIDGDGMVVEEIHALLNGDAGILCFNGRGNSVRNSEASSNSGHGIYMETCPGSSVIGNTVTGNGAIGIIAQCPSVVLQNMAAQNGGGDIIADPAVCTRSDNNPIP